jgi:hypothetical protein
VPDPGADGGDVDEAQVADHRQPVPANEVAIDKPTLLPPVTGLFILVEGLNYTGVLSTLAGAIRIAPHGV